VVRRRSADRAGHRAGAADVQSERPLVLSLDQRAPPGITALKAFAAVALLIGWIVCLRTAFVALGVIGVVLCTALLGTFVWLLFDWRVLQATDSAALAWIGLVILGIVLGIGLSWSLIRARTTGQIEVE